MPYLTIVLLLALLPFPLMAEGGRDQELQKYIGDGSVAARAARLGKTYSSPCHCTEGAALGGSDALVYHCACGTMQCVVAAARSGAAGAGDSPSLVCR